MAVTNLLMLLSCGEEHTVFKGGTTTKTRLDFVFPQWKTDWKG